MFKLYISGDLFLSERRGPYFKIRFLCNVNEFFKKNSSRRKVRALLATEGTRNNVQINL